MLFPVLVAHWRAWLVRVRQAVARELRRLRRPTLWQTLEFGALLGFAAIGIMAAFFRLGAVIAQHFR